MSVVVRYRGAGDPLSGSLHGGTYRPTGMDRPGPEEVDEQKWLPLCPRLDPRRSTTTTWCMPTITSWSFFLSFPPLLSSLRSRRLRRLRHLRNFRPRPPKRGLSGAAIGLRKQGNGSPRHSSPLDRAPRCFRTRRTDLHGPFSFPPRLHRGES